MATETIINQEELYESEEFKKFQEDIRKRPPESSCSSSSSSSFSSSLRLIKDSNSRTFCGDWEKNETMILIEEKIDKQNSIHLENKWMQMLMNKNIRNQLLSKLSWKDLNRLSRVRKSFNLFIKQYAKEYYDKEISKYESIEYFLKGCHFWTNLVCIDVTSVLFHAMSKLATYKFAIAETHRFIIVPMAYMQHAITICWSYINIISRSDNKELFKQSSVYHAIKSSEVSAKALIIRNNDSTDTRGKYIIDMNTWKNYAKDKERGAIWIANSNRICINKNNEDKETEKMKEVYELLLLCTRTNEKFEIYVTQQTQIIKSLNDCKIKIPILLNNSRADVENIPHKDPSNCIIS